MNGAGSLIRTLATGGVGVCFANPGTTEIQLVAALDQFAELRCVLGLTEGVVTGAADGYARMTGTPAATLLHLGPGLANGLANLHNANRARVQVVNIVGDHGTRHRRHDPPLAADIEAIARPYAGWLRTAVAVADLSHDAAEAIVAARAAPGRIATLIVPADIAWSEGGVVAHPGDLPPAPVPSATTVERAAAMLRAEVPTGLVLAGNALFGEGLHLASRLAAVTGATLLAPYSFTRMSRGAGTTVVERLPFPFEQATDYLKAFHQLILVGAAAPVAFFAYPGKPSLTTPPNCAISLWRARAKTMSVRSRACSLARRQEEQSQFSRCPSVRPYLSERSRFTASPLRSVRFYLKMPLWLTMAREGLAVTTVVLVNRAYAILKSELANLRIGDPGSRARDLLEIERPDLDWVSLAKGLGVPAVKGASLDKLAGALSAGFASEGPNLIEVTL